MPSKWAVTQQNIELKEVDFSCVLLSKWAVTQHLKVKPKFESSCVLLSKWAVTQLTEGRAYFRIVVFYFQNGQ